MTDRENRHQHLRKFLSREINCARDPATVSLATATRNEVPPAAAARLEPLGYEWLVPQCFVCGHRRSDRQLQHGGVLTSAQLRQ